MAALHFSRPSGTGVQAAFEVGPVHLLPGWLELVSSSCESQQVLRGGGSTAGPPGDSTFCVPALLCHAPSAPAAFFLSPSLTAEECLSIPFLFLPVVRELFTSSLDTHCSPQGQVCSNLPIFGSEYVSFIFSGSSRVSHSTGGAVATCTLNTWGLCVHKECPPCASNPAGIPGPPDRAPE